MATKYAREFAAFQRQCDDFYGRPEIAVSDSPKPVQPPCPKVREHSWEILWVRDGYRRERCRHCTRTQLVKDGTK